MRLLKSALIFACLALPLMMLFNHTNAHAGKKKAKSIDELAARYDSSSCRECHEEIYEEWEASAHSKSIWGLKGRTALTFGTAVTKGLMTWPYSGVKKPKDVKVKHLMLCAKCHLPQLEEAEDKVAKEIIQAVFGLRDKKKRKESEEKLQKLSINCLICHQMKAITHKWAQGFPEKNVVYGTKDGEHDDENYPVMKRSEIRHESVFCGQCHGLGPNLEFEEPSQCATLYGSYLFAYVPEGGRESCQHCHMRKYEKGHLIPSYRDPDMAKEAIEFEADAFSYFWRKNKAEGVVPMAAVRVEMINKAGHAIPDG
jgi:hypothetical protein